jgi:hypothetical protein
LDGGPISRSRIELVAAFAGQARTLLHEAAAVRRHSATDPAALLVLLQPLGAMRAEARTLGLRRFADRADAAESLVASLAVEYPNGLPVEAARPLDAALSELGRLLSHLTADDGAC